ncbi:MAG: D-alanyl-D-alanine carboxypeptidase/D-alanyl-D-alanine-endopeptidase [Candidatus Dadabacteria bacterium]|nr:D-alanyl-D-alanine carboxypeptidase/D-alanyl-D-alanine-endopeptidase [Candidatus Dadabacteria bacterium]NIS07304.1 D-alanyl-D-alanine carboxypeptidase/D-alanyl-D-alanine-endopeptidase [Candidatus Dadabacteria bacterium]NIY20942.1 D-alanyl-D-alanine carboxypeptidase/D-alanyl-D-alanine-endopeptidase [Candidatus Dadabacteria bacterium]
MRSKYIIYLTLGFFLSLVSYHISFAAYSAYSSKLNSIIPASARKNSKLGVVVKSLISKKKIFEYNSDTLFIPASNQKVIVSTVALSLLKSNFRFKTAFYAGGEIKGGVLHGGLYVKGYADPTINTEALRLIAMQFKQKGLTQVNGDLYLDDSYFDDLNYPIGWKSEWRDDFYSPPISALSLNYNNLEVVAYPSKNRSRVVVTTDPRVPGLKITNSSYLRKKKNSIKAKWAEGREEIIVSGRLYTYSKGVRLKLPVKYPSLYFGRVLKHELEQQGITISGQVKFDTVPRWANIYHTYKSDRLDEVVGEYNKKSVNIIGENLIKTLGAEFIGTPGSWESGRKIISLFLKNIGIKNGFKIVDGSGLSLLNRLSPNALADVLEYAFQNKSVGLDFITSLPVAGIDGTLKKRFKDKEMKGRIVAKTGYLKNVRSLSGYVFTTTGDVLVFSILSNGLGHEAKKFQSDLLAELVSCCEG